MILGIGDLAKIPNKIKYNLELKLKIFYFNNFFKLFLENLL